MTEGNGVCHGDKRAPWEQVQMLFGVVDGASTP